MTTSVKVPKSEREKSLKRDEDIKGFVTNRTKRKDKEHRKAIKRGANSEPGETVGYEEKMSKKKKKKELANFTLNSRKRRKGGRLTRRPRGIQTQNREKSTVKGKSGKVGRGFPGYGENGRIH